MGTSAFYPLSQITIEFTSWAFGQRNAVSFTRCPQ